MNVIFWISIIILVIILVLTIWMLARGSESVCTDKGKLNDKCTQTSDCNSGLVCDITSGSDRVCKVANGGVCSSTNQCGEDLICKNGICKTKLGGLGDPCPCEHGLTCDTTNKCVKIIDSSDSISHCSDSNSHCSDDDSNDSSDNSSDDSDSSSDDDSDHYSDDSDSSDVNLDDHYSNSDSDHYSNNNNISDNTSRFILTETSTKSNDIYSLRNKYYGDSSDTTNYYSCDICNKIKESCTC